MIHITCPEEVTRPATDTRLNAPKRTGRKRVTRHEHSWFDGPYNPTRGETALWVAVITQAMMDALSRSGNPETLYHKQAAVQWLTGNSKDFLLVCLFAGMDPDYVRRKAKRAMVAPVAWRAAPGHGRRYLERRAYRQRMKKERTAKKTRREEEYSPPHPAAAQVIVGPWR